MLCVCIYIYIYIQLLNLLAREVPHEVLAPGRDRFACTFWRSVISYRIILYSIKLRYITLCY